MQNKLSDMFYKPFLAPLLETYNFLKEEDMVIFRKYLAQHSGDKIQSFSSIKQRYAERYLIRIRNRNKIKFQCNFVQFHCNFVQCYLTILQLCLTLKTLKPDWLFRIQI